MNEKEYKKSLRQFHKHSDRHILVVETDMSFSDIQKVVALSDKIRKAGNELVGLMRKNYDQLIRTKRYRKVRKLYGATEEKKKRKVLARQLNEMQKQYHVTWDDCRTSMIIPSSPILSITSFPKGFNPFHITDFFLLPKPCLCSSTLNI